MAIVPITVDNGFQGGRTNAYNPARGESFLRWRELMLAADIYEFNFPNAQALGNTFGQVRAVFINNTDNDFDLTLTVGGTQFSMPIYKNTTGVYNIDSQEGSNIVVTTAGNSTDKVEIIFYNAPKIPFVWYETNPVVTGAVTIADGADVALGATGDAAITNPASAGTLIAFTKGIVTLLASIVASIASAFTIRGNQVTYTDRSGTVTLGGTAQTLAASNASRRGFTIQNNSTANLTVNSLGTATTTAGIIIAPGQLYEWPETGIPTTAISILGATTGQRFDAREWN